MVDWWSSTHCDSCVSKYTSRLFLISISEGLFLLFRVVYARLIVKQKDYGVKPFIVQLRDPMDFSLRPGVSIGDCGKKMVRKIVCLLHEICSYPSD